MWIIPFSVILKPGSLRHITNEVFYEGSSNDSNQIFSYLLQFQHTCFTEHSSLLLMKSEERLMKNINQKKISNVKVKRRVLISFFCLYSFSICFLIRTVGVIDNLQLNQLTVNKKCVADKAEILFIINFNFILMVFYFNGNVIYFSLWVSTLSCSRKIGVTEPYSRKCLLVKTAKIHMFSTVNRKWNFLSAAGRTPRFGPSRKPKTLYTAPIYGEYENQIYNICNSHKTRL